MLGREGSKRGTLRAKARLPRGPECERRNPDMLVGGHGAWEEHGVRRKEKARW